MSIVGIPAGDSMPLPLIHDADGVAIAVIDNQPDGDDAGVDEMDIGANDQPAVPRVNHHRQVVSFTDAERRTVEQVYGAWRRAKNNHLQLYHSFMQVLGIDNAIASTEYVFNSVPLPSGKVAWHASIRMPGFHDLGFVHPGPHSYGVVAIGPENFPYFKTKTEAKNAAHEEGNRRIEEWLLANSEPVSSN